MPHKITTKEKLLIAKDDRRSIFEEVEKQAREDVLRDVWGHLDSTRKLRLVSFISTSNGKDRPKRRPREVSLLVDHSAAHGKIAYQVIGSEIRSRKSNHGLSPDVLAQEILADLPKEDRTASVLIERIFDRARRLSTFN